jgi:succinylglutamic semialdehyde dehydrogenase
VSTGNAESAWLRSVSPADPSDEIGTFPIANESAVGAAVERARQAFPAWRDAGLAARAQVLQRFREAAAASAGELANLISREVGKALWDARGEASLLAPKVDVTLSDGMQLVAPLEAGPNARASFHARGVLAVLGPFNFPAHLPNGHIVPALATGNTVVFKPSEIAPAVGEWLAELWRKAELPEGVFQVVQGGGETGRTLAAHAGIDGVLFTGSYAVGRALKQASLDQPGKLLALEMGGNNAMLVLANSDLDLAVSEAALSIAATTGQRCSCAGRLFVERSVMDAFSDKLVTVLRGLRVGPPLEDGVFMGPLASQDAYQRIAVYRELSRETDGERLLLVEPELPPPYVGAGLMRFTTSAQTHRYQRDEIFGPEASLYPIDDLDEAIHAVNDSDYGLVASVMTRDRAAFEHCVGRIRTGLLNWNKATVGASGKLPFGGGGRSGNDRPAGVTATVYCTVPQAHLEGPAEFDANTLPPGMPRP